MKKILLVILVVYCLTVHCFGEESEIYEQQYDALGLDEVQAAVPEEADYIELCEDISFEQGLQKIFQQARRAVKEIFTSGLRCTMTIIAVSMLCGVVSALAPQSHDEAIKNCASLVGAISITASAAGNIAGMVGVGRAFIADVDSFSKTLLPAMAAAEAACGMAGSAVARASAAALFSDLLITIINYVLLPLTYVNIFAATANAAAESSALRRICDLCVKVVSGMLKFFLGAYVSYITIAGLVSNGVDKVGLKTAKFAIGGTVPIVGGIISDAAETVIAGAGLVKNTIGIFGMLVILAACITPVLTLAINYFLFKVTSTCAAPMIGGGVSELTERLAQSFGLVLAMCASSATVIFIAIISAMRSVGVM